MSLSLFLYVHAQSPDSVPSDYPATQPSPMRELLVITGGVTAGTFTQQHSLPVRELYYRRGGGVVFV